MKLSVSSSFFFPPEVLAVMAILSLLALVLIVWDRPEWRRVALAGCLAVGLAAGWTLRLEAAAQNSQLAAMQQHALAHAPDLTTPQRPPHFGRDVFDAAAVITDPCNEERFRALYGDCCWYAVWVLLGCIWSGN